MKKLSNTEDELNKRVAYKKACNVEQRFLKAIFAELLIPIEGPAEQFL